MKYHLFCFYIMLAPFNVLADEHRWYRSDVPEVINVPENQNVDQERVEPDALADFRRQYELASSPDVMVFWQRVISDRLDKSAYHASTMRTDVSELKDSFNSVLKDAGLRLISREYGTRAVAADKMLSSPQENGQDIELIAASTFADKVLEVVLLETEDHINDYYAIRMIDTESGLLDIDSVVTISLRDTADKKTVIADETGFHYKDRSSAFSDSQKGAMLASEILTLFAKQL